MAMRKRPPPARELGLGAVRARLRNSIGLGDNYQ